MLSKSHLKKMAWRYKFHDSVKAMSCILDAKGLTTLTSGTFLDTKN